MDFSSPGPNQQGQFQFNQQQQQQQQQQPNGLANVRHLTNDQLQNIYKRLQQLKLQHGDGVNQLPEYTELATILTQYVQYQKQLQAQAGNRPPQQQQQQMQSMQLQQQQLQQQQQQRQFQQFQKQQDAQQKGQQTPKQMYNQNQQQQMFNQAQNQAPPMYNSVAPQQFQQQQQQQPQPANATQMAQPGQSQPSNIFSPQQSQLLKYQIAAFKKFIQSQPVNDEIANVINISFQQFTRQQQQQQQFIGQVDNGNGMMMTPHLQGQHQMPLQVPVQQQSGAQQQMPLVPPSAAPNASATKAPPKRRPKKSASTTPASIPTPTSATTSLGGTNAGANKQKKQPASFPPQQRVIKQEPPRPTVAKGVPPHAPIPLPEMTKKFPLVGNIISTQDPLCVVDSYTVPQFPEDTPYEHLNSPRSRVMIPSLYPKPLDIKGANEAQKLVEALRIDEELEKLNKLKEEDISYWFDYEALKLLPFQKAVRGHVLGCVFHQNMLLTNHLPNFSAKSRIVNMQDASVTNALYTQQKTMAILSQKNKIVERQANILNASNDYKKYMNSRKDKYQRLAKNVSNFHIQTEKDDQRRIERNAKQRLQALKANDEEAYIKLLDQTKDTRITHLLRQTNAFLDSLTQAVRDQQKETEERLHESGHNVEDEEHDASTSEDSENVDYYSVAHKIKESITKQPNILVGGTLKEYQLRGLEWMVSLFNNHLNGILADEMGLGKTIQTISLLTYIAEVKKIKGPFLVIVPLSTLPNWNLEFDKWAPSLKKISYKGTPQYRKDLAQEVKAGNFEILLTTYEYVIKDKALLSKIKWIHMIIDEGHRMKNAKSKLSHTLTDFYHSDYRLILTGTPLQNNLPELWALLNFVLPKIFNSVKSFDEWFNTPFANAGSQDKIELSEEETLLVIRRLHKVLRPFLLRRLKKDVEKSLPNKVEKVIKCKKSSLQSKLYHQMLKYNQLFIGDSDSKAPVGIKGMNNKLMQLRKICNHPFVFPAIEDLINPTHANNDQIWRVSGKFELLDRVLPKFQNSGHRVLMFFQMTQIMDIMEDFLRYKGMQYMRLDGDTKADDRTSLLKDFNAEGSQYFVFLLSTRAGGLGLNLQTADTVIIFDTDWNPHQDLQAQDRAHRIGQKNEVRILRLITEDSIEEYILERAHQKLDIDGKVIQAGKFDQKSTSEEQEALLRQLLESEEGERDDDEELDESELNEILARDDDELKLFMKMDQERVANSMGKPRLYTEAELPEIYNIEPEIVEEVEDTSNYGRGARERKITHYDENLTEEQWLREINGYASDDDDRNDNPKKRKRAPKRAKSEVPDDNASEMGDFVVNDDEDAEDGSAKKIKAEPAYATANGTANGSPLQTATATASVARGKGRGRARGGRSTATSRNTTQSPSDSTGASLAAGLPKKKKHRGIPVSTPICRDQDLPLPTLTDEEREVLQSQLQKIFDRMVSFTNEVGRKLSTIFMVKPVRRIYPDYYVIIKNPIAFDGIKRRVQSEVYYALDEFLYDLHLMFANARIYNQEGSVIYQDSKIMEKAAMDMYCDLTDGKTIDFMEFDKKFSLTRPAIAAGADTTASDPVVDSASKSIKTEAEVDGSVARPASSEQTAPVEQPATATETADIDELDAEKVINGDAE